MEEKPLVLLITTGGTIAMEGHATQGVVPAVSAEDLVASVPQLEQFCRLELFAFSNMPSPHMMPKTMFGLSQIVEEALLRPELCGIVITHGTDTLEETAYMLDLLHKSDKAVCITGAMRSADELSADGPMNLLCAVRTAVCPQARNCGVLVVMSEEIHAAREVVKTHTAHTETFMSPFWGPLAYIEPDKILFRRMPIGRQGIFSKVLVDDVHLIKMVAGADGWMLDKLVERQVRGIVLEAFGRGNVPPIVVPSIRNAVENNIPVILTSRVTGGRVLDIYGYEGGAKHVLEAGAMLGGETSGLKARLKLMLALGLTQDMQVLQTYFDTP